MSQLDSHPPRILVTGATGKVGQAFIKRLLEEPAFERFTVRALCHNRKLTPGPRLEVVSGSIEHREVVARAVSGVTHVLHLATSKETPESIMDVAVKGLFWLLEACRGEPDFQQFILIGGDAGMGHFFYPHPIPVTETQKHSAYPGCYALSKVLEEVMLEQYYVQYDLQRLLPARALDHGEGRLQVSAVVRRRRLRRPALARPGRRREGRRVRRRRRRAGHARSRRPAR